MFLILPCFLVCHNDSFILSVKSLEYSHHLSGEFQAFNTTKVNMNLFIKKCWTSCSHIATVKKCLNFSWPHSQRRWERGQSRRRAGRTLWRLCEGCVTCLTSGRTFLTSGSRTCPTSGRRTCLTSSWSSSSLPWTNSHPNLPKWTLYTETR